MAFLKVKVKDFFDSRFLLLDLQHTKTKDMNKSEIWVPIPQYAKMKGLSVNTVYSRVYKNLKGIEFKKEWGRYLIKVSEEEQRIINDKINK